MKFTTLSSLGAVLLPSLVSAQLSGSVGPLTTRAEKNATKVCNVMDYGAVASKTSDISAPLTSAFADCKTGGVIYIPEGDYGMTTFVTLSGGNAWAIQLDGIIYRYNGGAGNMIMIKHSTDFELFSSNSAGAIQGYGYQYHAKGEYGPRLLRLSDVSHFSVHDIALVDAPAFHFSLDTCDSGEVYNMIIRGGNEGGLDGIDVWSTNIWIHDIEVTNKDECVTVKSPSANILIEDIYCNSSGGCAMGSLGADTNISNIIYNNVYTYGSNQMYMIKSNGGSGTVTNCQFNNFIGHSNAYSLDFDTAWSSMSVAAGDGIEYTDISFNNWKGTCTNGAQRGPISIKCPAGVPCTNVTVTDFAMWTESGSTAWYKCENAYGSGGCLASGTNYKEYSTTTTLTAAPTGYSAATMAGDLATAFGLTASIPIPAIPTSFFPGATPVSALMKNGGGAAGSSSVAKVVSTPVASSSVAKITSSSAVASATSAKITSASSSVVKPRSSSSAVEASSSAVIASSASSALGLETSSSSAAAVAPSSTFAASQTTLLTRVSSAATAPASTGHASSGHAQPSGGHAQPSGGYGGGKVTASASSATSAVAAEPSSTPADDDDTCDAE
ncbi:putative rhamnogalacturonase B protein [Rutstroemia sp. NJR-2017a WRK4]|nr:putative rhamnogalacturonase B protein [Rutstroemia sp. NJR-2017a WRK4]